MSLQSATHLGTFAAAAEDRRSLPEAPRPS